MPENGSGLESLVLEGKTTAPAFDPGFVRRTERIRELSSSESRLVTVTAPAGYGKTSLLAEWQQSEERATGWLTLSADDDDPGALMHLIAHAVVGFAPDAASLVGRVSAADDGVLGRIAPALALALSRSELPFVLFLDDVHTISDTGCVDALNVVLAGIPKGSQVVFASRHRPTQFARGLLSASAVQVGAEDLRIDLAGAARIAEEAGARVDVGTLDAWVQQCDGWAAGLHMYALLSENRPFTSIGDQGLLADYLYQECMKDLPEATRRFLTRTSILQVLLPELCDAILERSDSASILRELEARQLFVTADRGRRSYHLHPLFREYLLGELHLEEASTVPLLHGRACQWFVQQGEIPAAIDSAIAAGDLGTASMLLPAAALDAYESGQVATLGRWLDEIGDANLLANPASVIVTAWVSILSGTDAAASKWGTLLGSLPDDLPPLEGMNVPSAKAMIRAILMKQGMSSALADAEFAVAAEPFSSPWRDPALQILGSTLLHSGDEVRGRQVLEEALHTADAHGNPATIVMCESEFALLALEEGDWAAAAEHTARALQTIQTSSIEGYVMCAYAHAAAAVVDLRAGQRATGERLLNRAMSERQRCMRSVPLMSVPTRLMLIHAHLQIDDLDAARMLFREIEEMLPSGAGREALDARVAAAQLALEERERLLDGRSAASVALTLAEQRVLPYLQTHLTRAEIAERLFVSKNTVGTQISSIFRKLDASNRTDAVRRACSLGLLGGDAELAGDER